MMDQMSQGVVRFPVPTGREPVDAVEETSSAEQTILELEKIVQAENVAELLSESELGIIGKRCVDEYQDDEDSREEWLKQSKEAIKLAKLVYEEKAWPWPKAASVKFPLLAEAAISFAARAYPEIIRGNDVVLAKVIGKDPDGEKADRARRISDFMSYQCTEEMDFWESDTDKMLHLLAIVGTCFRKTYFDPDQQIDGKSGVISRLVSGMDLVINHNLTSYEQVRRETEIIDLYGNDVEERRRSGLWLDVDLKPDTIEGKEDLPQMDRPYRFLEQHRWLDLDNDGYEEPYIVTVHEASTKVVRIVARFETDNVILNRQGEVVRIEPIQHYTKYGFIPNPDGGIYDLGFGTLLLPLNEAINTNLNQLLDSGTLANLQGGFLAKGVRLRTGAIRTMPGQWNVLDTDGATLRDSVMPNPSHEPSPTLFQLVGFLVEAGRNLASIKDVLQGNIPNQNVPATTVLAMIEQGQKVYNAIHKRVYRSLKAEFKKQFRLNGKYLSEELYQNVEDDRRAVVREDFSLKDYDVCPIADPQVSSQAQRLAKAQALMQMMQIPGAKQQNIIEDYLLAVGVEDPGRYFPSADELESGAAEQAEKQKLIDHLTLEKALVEIENKQAASIKQIADALVAITKAQTDKMSAQVDSFTQQMNVLLKMVPSEAQEGEEAQEVQQPQQQMPPEMSGPQSGEEMYGDPNAGGMGPMAQPEGQPMVLPEGAGGNPPPV